MAECPLCDAPLDLEEDELEEGDFLVCDECGACLTVAGIDPLEIEEAEEELVDDDGDDYDDEADPWKRGRSH